MRLLIVRHGEAGEPGFVYPDSERPLTEEGKALFRAFLPRIQIAMPEATRIITSPYLRTRQTAEILSELYTEAEVRHEETLASGASLDELLKIARSDSSSKAIVGHEPELGLFVSHLLAPGAEPFVQMPKGGAAVLSYRGGCWSLEWFLRPA